RQREKQGTKVADSSKGPEEAKIKALLERKGHALDVTTGQRKYWGPPPDSVYSSQQPSFGTEIFVGKIPRDLLEDELVSLFEKAGSIWDLHLMMDLLTGLNKGYAFVTFCTKEAAQEVVKLYNNHEIHSGKHIVLFVGCMPKSKTKEQILEEFSKVTEGLTNVILYQQPDDKMSKGFCFLEYEDQKTAARHRLMSGKVLFVRNLANTVTEEILEEAFSQFGKLERIMHFFHFDERDGAVKAMEEINGKDLDEEIEIVFAKPPNQKRKERKAQRQVAKNQMYDDYFYYGLLHIWCGGGGGGYPPDDYGNEDYYDCCGYDYHNCHGGYEELYYGYEEFQAGARGRSGRGARDGAPSRGRGAAPPLGRAREGPGSARGILGVRGGPGYLVQGVQVLSGGDHSSNDGYI
uniref:RRM domain-containing protein n=1 Tax=Jaculus jaculus TaxID=51337 RepID=A0A8C5P3K0_JACJA